MTYNPFDKQVQDLLLSDLDLLIGKVAEGYWVEYKSRFPENSKIAKGIASLANSYGGWYFIGVDSDKQTNIATNICGISLVETPDPISKIRESIKVFIDPTPIFYIKLIEIEPNKAIVVVYVPENQETPFIHKDGRIYRRIADSSEPIISETNRFAVDKLYENGKELAKRFEDFCHDNRTFSQSEENQGWIKIYISPTPLDIKNKEIFSIAEIEKVIQLSNTPLPTMLKGKELGRGNLPFNSSQFGFGSVILRQIQQTQVAFNSLHVEFFMDGRAKFYIPLEYFDFVKGKNTPQIKSLCTLEVLQNLSQKRNVLDNSFDLIRFFDIHKTLWVITHLMTLYLEWLKQDLENHKLRYSIVCENIWRTVPFCDIDEWGKHVQKYGLPIQNYDFLKIPNQKWIELEAPTWLNICSSVLFAFGLPYELLIEIMFKDLPEH